VSATLYDFLPRESARPDVLLDAFLNFIQAKKLELYPAQEAAILELFEGKNVILNTPTGSGKSLVAAALHFKSLAQGKRSVYTCPIKALVNEKWMALCKEFGPQNIGLSTGDATVNHDAPILCCTAEILANIALHDGPNARVDDVVMDEFHYYSDRERGVAWQVPLLTLSRARFLLMSATLGETQFFEEEMTRLNGLPSATISSKDRPVPLEFSYAETPLATTLEALVAENKSPIYVVHFTQNEAADSAQDFTSINVCTREEKAQIAQAIEGVKFTSPYGPEIKKWLRHGIGIHHAGLLPKYRILVEQLAQRGLLKIISGTDTLGVGVNVPIRTVLFTRLCKFDGQKTGILSARDFHQVSGRAGRKGFDDRGWVVAQAPEHVIENLKLEEKSARDGKKVTKRKAPDKNFVNWDKQTFARLINAQPERLSSHFQVTHGMLLNVLSRPADGCRAMQQLIERSHESPKNKKAHFKRGWQLFRSLVAHKVIEVVPPATDGSYLRVNVALQEDFSMDQTLSLYLIETLPLLDREAPDYALDLITLVESILENPEAILRRQLDKVKSAKMAEMKAQGVEYDERMEELEKLEYPKPESEFVYTTFNLFADRHPWVGQENIRPKSIVREMFEQYRSFSDYIKDYDLQRVEGLLLRHINSVYKVLAHTVPDAAKTEQVREMEIYLLQMLRQVDSSLMDEWEKMRNPGTTSGTDNLPPGANREGERPREPLTELRPPGSEEADKDITRDKKNFTAAIRNRIFTFLRACVNEDYELAVDTLSERDSWDAKSLATAVDAYFEAHTQLRLDPEARNTRHTYIKESEDKQTWRIDQMLIDREEENDWVAQFEVNLPRSRETEQPHLRFIRIGPLGG
jgi:superfamily II RNA helicase